MTVRGPGIPGKGAWLTPAAVLALLGCAWAAEGSTRKAAFIPLARTALSAPAGTDSSHLVQYNRDIRPILADNCFTCHGSDSNRRMAGLRFDRSDGPFKKLASGRFALVPGNPDASEILSRVTAKDSTAMPPAAAGRRLTAAEVSTLRQWIAQGAKYQEHWSFIKPVRPPLPAVKNAWWPRGAVDRFVLAHLETEGLRPSPSADRRTLIRRLSLDLTGLPPSMEEVQVFLADKSPDAYEKVVDRLLASPQYGERMAEYWLDLVRYADTDGYHGDRHRDVFPYRDYVINAYNHNMPFDQFTVEQLAGDLLPNATLEQKVASGYNRLNMVTREGGAQAKEYLAKYAAERIRTTSQVWLGVTLGCAECHDHKFDPFTAKDFYSFGAFFADLKQVGVYSNDGPIDPTMTVPSPEQAGQLSQLDSSLARIKTTLDTPTPELAAAQSKWEGSVKLTNWTALHPESVTSANGATLTIGGDNSILASGKAPDTDTYTVTAKTPLHSITAFRLEALPDKSLPMNGPGRAGNGNMVLTGFTVTAKAAGPDPAHPIPLQNATATFEQKFAADGSPYGLWTAASVIDANKKDPAFGWAIMEQVGKENSAVFETKTDSGTVPETTLTFVLQQLHPGHTIGRFRLSATTDPRPVRATTGSLPAEITTILAVAAPARTADQQKTLAAYYRSIAPELQPARTELAGYNKSRDDLVKAIPTTLVSESVQPAVVRILPRGNWMDDSGEIVKPAVPHFLPQLPAGQPADRLALARWMISKDNPLTARVYVNRLWMLLFGEGIARSPGDLGTQGPLPTHPQLLDWLAVEFMDSGWDTKHLIKLMVMSNAYRQTSHTSRELLERDPYNLLLARQGRFRMDAEVVRDNALSIAGTLSLKMGGRSVKPYQPDGYWDLCNTFAGRLVYDQDHNEDLYRRGLYTYWKRTFLHPSLLAFDAPSREECTVERTRSNTPLQALVLLNDPTYVESARVFAEHIVRQGGPNIATRLNWAFERAICRPITPREATILAALQKKHLAEYSANRVAAGKIISVGEWPVPKDLDVAELASWTSVARVILNLHETITRE